MSHPHVTPEPPKKRALDPFRRAVLRGLGVLLPPLLTIVIFLWVGATISKYLLAPLQDGTRWVLLEYASDIRDARSFDPGDIERVTDDENNQRYRVAELDGLRYRETPDRKFIPREVYQEASAAAQGKPLPDTARGIYGLYHDATTLRPVVVVPFFLAVFVLALYLLGKFLAAGIGSFFWAQFESLIHRLPVVRNVYSSVKQVTDFLFTDPEMEFTRVVAIEYPRKGIWTVAFVTGESMLDIESAANESVMSVLIPTSPMPFTGFTVTVKKSETIDLNLSIDQAFQFIISCGVVVPPQQLTAAAAAAARNGQPDAATTRPPRLTMPATPTAGE